jgi:bacterioferritin-associated ferredoxin
MIQSFLIIALFIAAAIYLGRLLFRSFQAKNACESGCGKCGAADLQKIENELKAKGL